MLYHFPPQVGVSKFMSLQHKFPKIFRKVSTKVSNNTKVQHVSFDYFLLKQVRYATYLIETPTGSMYTYLHSLVY